MNKYIIIVIIVIIPQTIIVLTKSIIVASLGGNTANRAIGSIVKMTTWEIPSPRPT